MLLIRNFEDNKHNGRSISSWLCFAATCNMVMRKYLNATDELSNENSSINGSKSDP